MSDDLKSVNERLVALNTEVQLLKQGYVDMKGRYT